MRLLSSDDVRVAKDSELVSRAAAFAEFESELEGPEVDASQLWTLSQSASTGPRGVDRLPDGTVMLWKPNPPFGPYQLDRSTAGHAFTWSDYLPAWTHFCSHWEVAASQNSRGDYPAQIAVSAILNDNRDSLDTHRALVLELWSERWLLDSFMTGQMLAAVDRAHGVSYDDNRLEELLTDVLQGFSNAKDSSLTLDAWFQALHRLSPHVHLGMAIAHELGNNRVHRIFDELSADTGTVLSYLITLFLRGETFSSQHLRSDVHGVVPSTKDLRYKLNARVFFPRFWFDSATEWLKDPTPDLPAALNEFDVLAALGLAFSQSFDFCATALSWELPLKT